MKIQEILLIGLLVAVFATKLILLSASDAPAYDAYYGMRQVEHIKETGLPLLADELSYQGRSSYTNPLSYYLMTIFALFVPTELVFRYGGVLLLLAVIYLIYLVSVRLYHDKWIALLLASLAAFNSTVLQTHHNTLIPSSFFIIIYLLLLYSYVKKKQVLFLSLIVIGTLTSSLMLVLILGFIIYFVFLKLESLNIKKWEFELLFFSAVFVLWYNLIAYKKLLFKLGTQSIWQNIPTEVQLSLFSGLTLPVALTLIGIVPLALGIYGVYTTLFEKRNRQVLFFIALSFAFGILTWLGMLQLKEGLLYSIITLILVSGYSIERVDVFFQKTVAPWATKALVALVLVITLVSFTTVFIYQESLALQSPSEDELETFGLLDELIPEGETILTHIRQGHAVAALGNTKNFYDEHYILAPRAQLRYSDARNIYLSKSQAAVLGNLHQYGVKYVMTSDVTRRAYPSTTSLFEESDCFDVIYSTETTEVYKVQCILRT